MTKRTSAVTPPASVTEQEVEQFKDDIRAECVCQLFKLFDQIDDLSGMSMLDVLCATRAVGGSFHIGVETKGPMVEEPKPDIKIARA